MLVVQLAEPLDLLVGGGPLPEQQLLARRPEPVQQVQQGVPGVQRRLAARPGTARPGTADPGGARSRAAGTAPAQVDQAGPAEVVPQLVDGPHRQRRTAAARRSVQHDHRRLRLRARPGRLHPLPQPRHLLPSARERAVRHGKLPERLLQGAAPARGRALVGAPQLRPGPGRPGGRGEHPLLVQERPDAAHLQRGEPLQPQLLGPAGLAGRPGPVMGGRHMDPGHLHHRRRGADDPDRHSRAQRGAGPGAERHVGHHRRDGRHGGDQQRRAGALTGVALAEGELPGGGLVECAGVGRVLLAGRLRHRVQRRARPGEQHVPVRASARAPHLLLHGPPEQRFGLRPMTVPHVAPPPAASLLRRDRPGRPGSPGRPRALPARPRVLPRFRVGQDSRGEESLRRLRTAPVGRAAPSPGREIRRIPLLTRVGAATNLPGKQTDDYREEATDGCTPTPI
ncbi:hypothetical protein STENM223S_02217 [Streptomyces tendae]